MSKINNFSQLVNDLEGGQFNADASEMLQSAIEALTNSVLESGAKKAKAEMALKFEIVLDSGNVFILGSMASKLPVKPRGSSVFWTTKDNLLSKDNPHQPRLPFETINGGKKEVVNFNEAKEN